DHRGKRMEKIFSSACRRQRGRETTRLTTISQRPCTARTAQGSQQSRVNAHRALCLGARGNGCRRPDLPIQPSRKLTKDEKLAEVQKLSRAYRAWQREQLDAALASAHG